VSFQVDSLLRIALGAALGAAIGVERELHSGPAGLRTHALVALASATFMVVSTRFVLFQHYAPGDLVHVDASHIASSVVSGIGFLGAGAILRTGITVRGLTTAAGLWLVAAIGMASGGGMYIVAVFTTALGLLTLTVLHQFEARGEPFTRKRLTLTLDEGATPITNVVDALSRSGVKAFEEAYETDQGHTKLTFDLRAPKRVETHDLAQTIRSIGKGVRQIRIERY
jgi:putative Mg2+ transporter-C (MgtC) family protein